VDPGPASRIFFQRTESEQQQKPSKKVKVKRKLHLFAQSLLFSNFISQIKC
jgi:hypothetical protein